MLRAFADTWAGEDVVLLTAAASRAERDLRLGVLAQLTRAVPDAAGPVAGARAGHGPLTPDVVDGLGALVLALTRRAPVVLVVDDVQHADEESVQVLLHLRRRVRGAPLLLVLAEWERPALVRPQPHADLVRQPDTRVPLAPLTGAGVAELLATTVDHEAATRLAPACAHLTGGNPYLVSALVEDQRAAAPDADAPVVGPAFHQAVLDCAARWDPGFLDIARGLAVLGDAELLPELVELPPAPVAQALSVLAEAGLVLDGRVRAPEVVDALLAGLDPRTAADLHARAALLHYRRGADATEVARHLTRAGGVPDPWAVAPLRAAAEQSAVDDAAFAVRCLELAVAACADPAELTALRAALVRIAWRVNPTASARHLAALGGAVDGLGWREAVPVIRHLLWQGDLAGAGARMRATRAHAGPPDARTAAELRLATEWIFGRLREGDRDGVRAALTTADRAETAVHSWQRTAGLLDAWSRGSAKEASRAAEHVLQSCLGDVAPEVGALALLALDHVDRHDRVRYWCEVLTEQAARQGAVTWQAVLAAVRADIAVRRGDPQTAAAEATAALELLPAQSWGVLVGLPLAALIAARSAQGRHDEAAELVARPVPAALPATVLGVRYAHACGQHSLATGHALAALDAFEDCAAWMWGRDTGIPATIPWRSSLAQAYLLVGRRKEARELANQQLGRCAGGGSRLRGISLRVLALCGDPQQRVPVLREAVQHLEWSGDRVELARALADLSRAHRELGQLSSARLVLRKADQLSRACEAEPAPRVPDPVRPGRPAEVRPTAITAARSAVVAQAPVLSDAERKVAELAADGHTNREIGRKLYITVSTVEQHLTRVYRKLNVGKRTELPQVLAEVPEARSHEHQLAASG
ncbi:hypothetical protein BJP25_20640 [Actinokineospora bangkokensis]|uniref:HTH luxR-type domain-containing protein n=1 Tax=Actinokineospora bangkokensis TaxID=1193682 RepID=A0A1Q9LKC2_9PSEU|nr:hypothetical protein BJP25_20640 [Actinokineospora bangkokensis]